MKSFLGQVITEIVEVRFPFSGKVSAKSKEVGDSVKKWETIASLDKKQLQTELDKELADFERARAHFDKASEDEKQDLQLSLNVSVKNVELAKMRLDQADLQSPIDGIVLENNLQIGLNITPASSSVKLGSTNSLKFEFVIAQNELEIFMRPQKILIFFFKKTDGNVEAETQVPFFGERGKFKITAKLPTSPQIIPGMEGECKLIGANNSGMP